ncbi:MAG: hypothetical protein QXH95_04720, partial [Thermoplasmata archaeon]
MIEALKKRFKVGDKITIHTKESSFTGKIIDFEDACIVIETDENLEYIANSTIIRFTTPKSIHKFETTNTINNKNEENKNAENNILNKEDKQPKETIKPITEYKPGEKIPLELLEKLTDKKTKTPKTKPANTFKSFDELEKLILPEIEEENKRIVSANGVITKCFGDRNFGFITDKFGYDIWFGFQNVVDNILLDILRSKTGKMNIPVVFTLSKNSKGESAIFIQKPGTINQILQKVKKFTDENKIDIALGLLEQILYSYPECYSALKIKKELMIRGNTQKPKYRHYENNYQLATKAKNIDKDYETALKYYLIALENNEKKESCIKDIAMLYISMGDIEKAIEFMYKYEKELPENITTYNFLVNFYTKVKEYDKVIENIDLLLEERLVIRDKRKISIYLSQKGFALIQLNRLDEAKDVLEEAVSTHAENTYANRLLTAIEEKDEEKLNIAITEAEFETFGGGISKMLSETLESYDKYSGIPSKIVETKEFTKKTLTELRKLIEEAGKARPKDRANYLLSEAKLMQLLEPEAEDDLRSVLARYCNAMALNSIYEKYSLDIARTYYFESFNLEDNWESIKRQFILFIVSLTNIHKEILDINSSLSGKEINDTILSEILSKYLNNEKQEVWNNLLNSYIYNRVILTNTLSLLFQNDNIRLKSLNILKKNEIKINDCNNSFENYVNAWNQIREKRQREISKWYATVKSIHSESTSLDIIVSHLSDSLQELKRNWLTQLDTIRLNTISTDIYEVLNQYLRQSGYRDKERYYNFAKSQINQLITEIKEKPTKFSYEAFIPLLEKLDLLLEKSFKIVEEASTPVVKVSILGEASVVSFDKSVPIKLLIENSKDSSPIREISIEIITNEYITSCNKGEYYDSIDGGEKVEIHLKATISEKVLHDKATPIDVICKYKKRNQEEPIIINEQLTLRLYSEEEFEPIPNPYEKLANGGPVTDKSMFYGRNEFIQRITEAIINSDSKQVVIYGQKRSGKSSVLYHLKKSLEATNKTFCISFSIGDIFETLTSATFFYKILSLI